MEQVEELLCPLCDFSDYDSYFLLQHVELCHPENGDSPFIARDEEESPHAQLDDVDNTGVSTYSPSGHDTEEYIDCPRWCGETVTIAELPSHIELHLAEGMAFDGTGPITADDNDVQLQDERTLIRELETRFDTSLPDPLRNNDHLSWSTSNTYPSGQKKRDITDWKKLLLGPSSSKVKHKSAKAKHATVRRLGARIPSGFKLWKAELGPHAHEERMPGWLRKQLEQGAKITSMNKISLDGSLIKVEVVANETPDIVPLLAQLCEQDRSVDRAFLCHPAVQHVTKMSREGGFCGYRNIQMMVSFIQGTGSQGFEHFPGRIPSILHLQDLIESAWDKGINTTGRVETGGIRGTRKYIGTPEAQALFMSLGIGCEANAFSQAGEILAYELLLHAVEKYFIPTLNDPLQKVCRSSLPPIYFQHPGHSLTIVGFEKRKNGTRNLLVFDPIFKPSPGIQRLIGTNFRATSPERLLKAYRRGETYLGRYRNFELLKLTARLPPAYPCVAG
ncbi:MAG: hypothetical protein M1830_003377 [Pleopsidium flavum]|nr:MAG: hypothetical protein M1830_003377 [Pleopsidium flavum]